MGALPFKSCRFSKTYLAWALVFAMILGTGCKKFVPFDVSAGYPFQKRIKMETQGEVAVSIGVPSREETKEIFGADLYGEGIQPVWVKIENNSKNNLTLFPSSLDPEYFSPNEVAYKSRLRYPLKEQRRRESFFEDVTIFPYVASKQIEEGFVFTHVDKGSKYITVDLLTSKNIIRFTFVVLVPGLNIDYYQVDFEKLYEPGERKDLTLEQLRHEVERFPCCTFSKKGKLVGDPINLVVVGEGEDILTAFVRSGWRETERGKALKTLAAYLNKGRYDYAPMSPLWLFGREQDAGFQKPRETPHERNHFRLWLTPWTYRGKPVWIGAISRDIGLRYTTKSRYMFITHKIDSDVDETRRYFLEDLLAVNALEKIGLVKGVGPVPISDPQLNPMGDRWFSDGLRLVLFISPTPVDLDEVEVLPWEFPRDREAGTIEPMVSPLPVTGEEG